MFDLSWGEVMVIGAVALIVIGPKDLPKTLRTLGNMTAKVRRMAGEFQSQFNDAMREAELDEIRKQVEGVNQSVGSLSTTSFNPIQTVRDELKGAIEGPTSAAPHAGAEASPGASTPLPALGEPPPPPAEAGPVLVAAGTEASGTASSASPDPKPGEGRA
jgi:sec-independent protein translocase protein TatB